MLGCGGEIDDKDIVLPAAVVALDEVGGPAKGLRRARSTLGLPAAPAQDAAKAHRASLRPCLRSPPPTRAPPRAPGASATAGRGTRLRWFFPMPSRPDRRSSPQRDTCGSGWRRSWRWRMTRRWESTAPPRPDVIQVTVVVPPKQPAPAAAINKKKQPLVTVQVKWGNIVVGLEVSDLLPMKELCAELAAAAAKLPLPKDGGVFDGSRDLAGGAGGGGRRALRSRVVV
ncbi:hypothetical protein GUJ93_ZPchr0014g46821 [Zizania palustris]|uniref:Uncharacterized protein n=1 Tax=Zizania palustris TaxID=103762 RepID=A0A8J5TB51_ZIZPA|nr:hypothetical protein GUJ93_ZPchr0014g46821 [Zizania palustris]